MNVRFPLFAKILLWFLLNLTLLGAVFWLLFGAQLRLGLDSLLAGRAGERVRAVSAAIVSELKRTPQTSWNEALERFGEAYGLRFALFRRQGMQVAGQPIELPPEVQAKLTEGHGSAGGSGFGPPPGRGFRRLQEELSQAPEPLFLLHTKKPPSDWVGVCVPLFEPGQRWPLRLLLVSPSLRASGLLFDFTPWVAVGFGAVLLSVLFWIPLVHDLTRSVHQMTSATEDIANGHFTVRVNHRRSDELGRLGQAVNRMAERLGGFVSGQKRFLGDIAHELGSPLARLEMALGVLEDRVGTVASTEIQDAREEAECMSKLVHELLSFSRASLNQQVTLGPVNLADVVREVVEREAGPDHGIEQTMDRGLFVRADPNLLARALANLVRNSIRYAAGSGPITIAAAVREAQIVVSVSDCGPGVDSEHLDRVFDPFFRAEASRSRDTGGAGLGLSIVKTCVEACHGTVTVRNREPHGLLVELTLEASA